ncbi:hypothetical protein [Rosistilla oblonga]|uniref:hypothetical protein n=1 Tax=Rosistilla oblonga TaxID=2527990 RepID=UPI003A97545C
MQVTLKPVVAMRKRKRDGKQIPVPAKSPCGAQQLSILIDGKEIGLVLDRPNAPVSYLVRDLMESEKQLVSDAIAHRTGAVPSGSQQPPADEPGDEIGEEFDTSVDFE